MEVTNIVRSRHEPYCPESKENLNKAVFSEHGSIEEDCISKKDTRNSDNDNGNTGEWFMGEVFRGIRVRKGPNGENIIESDSSKNPSGHPTEDSSCDKSAENDRVLRIESKVSELSKSVSNLQHSVIVACTFMLISVAVGMVVAYFGLI